MILCYREDHYSSENTEIKRTKYIDVKDHFNRENIENFIVLVQFIKYKENKSSPYTMNLSGTIYTKHKEYLENYEDSTDHGRVLKVCSY